MNRLFLLMPDLCHLLPDESEREVEFPGVPCEVDHADGAHEAPGARIVQGDVAHHGAHARELPEQVALDHLAVARQPEQTPATQPQAITISVNTRATEGFVFFYFS